MINSINFYRYDKQSNSGRKEARKEQNGKRHCSGYKKRVRCKLLDSYNFAFLSNLRMHFAIN